MSSSAPSLRIPGPHRAVGLVVMWLGLTIRIWAVAALGRAFRTTVEVDPGQAVVSSGPYRATTPRSACAPSARRNYPGPMAADRKQIVRDAYAAFAAGDRGFFEQRLSDDFLFSAPPDPRLDRDGYFERCWPGAGRGQYFDVVRLIESGEEVVATYETNTSGGGMGRNTEIFTFDDDDRITRTEVYFGWTLE